MPGPGSFRSVNKSETQVASLEAKKVELPVKRSVLADYERRLTYGNRRLVYQSVFFNVDQESHEPWESEDKMAGLRRKWSLQI